jgi:plastocyanin
MRRFAIVLAFAVAVVATAVAGFSFAGVATGTSPSVVGGFRAAAVTTNVAVEEGEFYFKLSQDTVPVGTVVFTITNVGQVPHDFSIAGQKSAAIPSGGTGTLTVTFTEPGPASYLCTIGEHAELGMQGSLMVTGAAQTTTAVTTVTTGGTTQVVTTTQTTTVPAPKPTATVKVTEKEFKIILPTTTKRVKVNGKLKLITVVKPVKHGLVRFVVKNIGKLPHNFVIGGKQTLVLSSGKTGAINVTLKKGKYKYVCSITGHAALGMKGVLTVT